MPEFNYYNPGHTWYTSPLSYLKSLFKQLHKSLILLVHLLMDGTVQSEHVSPHSL